MKITTFDQLPTAVNDVLQKLEHLEQLLTARSQQHESIPDRLLNIDEAAAFLHLSVPTLYGKVHSRAIPFSKPGKRLYFSEAELTTWIKEGRRKTQSELALEASDFLTGQRMQNAKK